MDIRKIKKLIELLEDSDVAEIETLLLLRRSMHSRRNPLVYQLLQKLQHRQ